jgi:hypothetical protein
MDLGDLVEFARQTEEDAQLSSPNPPADLPDAPMTADEAAGLPTFDITGRPQVPSWVWDQEGIAAEGLVLEDDEIGPPQTSSLDTRPDTVAYYLPYHFYRPRVWGIYVLESGVLGVAQQIGGSWPPQQDALDVVWDVLVDHERFHCFAESAVTRGESLVLERLYRPYYFDRHATPYEEAMANAHAYRRLKSSRRGYLPEIAVVLKSGGHGYDGFEAFVKGHAFGRGQAFLAGRAGAQDRRHSTPLGRGRGSLRFLFSPVRSTGIPVRLVPDLRVAKAVRRFPSWGGVRADAHVDDHPPEHFHVSIPPGSRPFRLTWPNLDPTGIPRRELSNRERKALIAYLGLYGPAIRRRLTVAYGHDVGPFVAGSG